jgi:hypothetical protein
MKDVIVEPKAGWNKYFFAKVPDKRCAAKPVADKRIAEYLQA